MSVQDCNRIVEHAMRRIKDARKRHNPKNVKLKGAALTALNAEIDDIKADASLCLVRWL